MSWIASEKTDDDLIAARDYIQADNDQAAVDFLDTTFAAFDRLGQFPQMGMKARLKSRALSKVRFLVLPPPFNRWLVFYEPRREGGVFIRRVLCGQSDWRGEPERFF